VLKFCLYIHIMEQIAKIEFEATGAKNPRLLKMYDCLKEYKYAGSNIKPIKKLPKIPHTNKCICGNKIKINHYIHNEKTNDILVVGSTCMNIFEKEFGVNFKINPKNCAWCLEILDDNRRNHCKKCKSNKSLICGEYVDNNYGYSICNSTVVNGCSIKCKTCDYKKNSCKRCYTPFDSFQCSDCRRIKEFNSRIYFIVAYKDKDKVKEHGARWDPKIKKWYVYEQQKIKLMELGYKVATINPNNS